MAMVHPIQPESNLRYYLPVKQFSNVSSYSFICPTISVIESIDFHRYTCSFHNITCMYVQGINWRPAKSQPQSGEDPDDRSANTEIHLENGILSCEQTDISYWTEQEGRRILSKSRSSTEKTRNTSTETTAQCNSYLWSSATKALGVGRYRSPTFADLEGIVLPQFAIIWNNARKQCLLSFS